MIVVDTNVISYLLLPNEKYGRLSETLFEQDKNWIAPSLWYYEFFSVLTVYFRQSIIDEDFFSLLLSKALDIIDTENIVDLNKIIGIIKNSGLSAYDAQYVALANEKGLPLITQDRKILSEFPNIAVSLEDFISP